MPEGIGENSDIETKEIPNYIEIGDIPETGKHKNIRDLYDLGLNVPPTLVCDYQSLNNSEVVDWLRQEYKDNDLQIRTTTADEGRNNPSMRDPSTTVEDFLKTLDNFSQQNKDKIFILQSIPKGCINKDILSGNIYRNRNRIVVELWPDLASWGNRLNKSALWRYTITMDGGFVLEKNTSEKIAKSLWRDILYRRGRAFIKQEKTKKVPPKIEKADPTANYYEETIKYAESQLKDLEDKHDAVKYYFDKISEGKNILDIFPSEVISLLEKDMRRLLENPDFTDEKAAKFSLLLGDVNQMMYWDLIPQHWDNVVI